MKLPKLTVSLFCLMLSLSIEARQQHEYNPGTLDREQSLALYSTQQKQNSFAACTDQFPKSRPVELKNISSRMKPMALCSDQFAVLYSQTSKNPIVVFERLTANRIFDAKGEDRTNQFYPDPRIPKGSRSELEDFKNSSFDRGHQSPAGNSGDHKAMSQSFALSNMIPQNSFNNRKTWNKIESDVRKFSTRAAGNVFVFTGPIYDEGTTTIGRNRVWVPTRLFKLVYDESSKRAWAYVVTNDEAPMQRPITYETFVKITGLTLLDNLPIAGSIRVARN